MSKLKCITVETIAFDNQSVTLEGDKVLLIIRLKNQEDFGTYVKGKEYDFTIHKPVSENKQEHTEFTQDEIVKGLEIFTPEQIEQACKNFEGMTPEEKKSLFENKLLNEFSAAAYQRVFEIARTIFVEKAEQEKLNSVNADILQPPAAYENGILQVP